MIFLLHKNKEYLIYISQKEKREGVDLLVELELNECTTHRIDHMKEESKQKVNWKVAKQDVKTFKKKKDRIVRKR